MSRMLKSSGAMGLATLLSRVLGVVRESLYARFMGDTPVAAAFKMAFMVPNLFRRLLGEGALTAAFIPIFKEKEKLGEEREMWDAANAVISGMVIAASVIIAVVILGISVIIGIDAQMQPEGLAVPGAEVRELFEQAPPAGMLEHETKLMLRLARLMFPYMLLVCMAAILMGMLNARGHFFIPALGSTVLNVTLIVTVLLIAPRWGETLEEQIFALAYGVLVAGVAQAFYLLPSLRREGFQYRWIAPWRNETVRVTVRRMIPGMMGVAAFQLNVALTMGIAWIVNPVIVASFDYAVRLMEFPQGLFGISLATYLLPTLTGLAAEKKYPEFRSTLAEGLGYLGMANVIACVLLIVLAEPIVSLLFERGEFGPESTERAVLAVRFLAPGLVAFSMVNILARSFYALRDTRTPMIISCVCLMVNVVLTFLLIWPLAQGGMALANTLTSTLNVYLLLYALHRKLSKLEMRSFWVMLVKMAACSIPAGAAAWFVLVFWREQLPQDTLGIKAGAVFIPAAVAGVIYFGCLLGLRLEPARAVVKVLRRGKGE